ncbi:hypothetical protein [Paraburkholderia terrae]
MKIMATPKLSNARSAKIANSSGMSASVTDSPAAPVSLLMREHTDANESGLQNALKSRLAWRSSGFSDNLAPRKIIDEIKILGVFADEHTRFFRGRLDAMIDMRHPLAVLATRMSWAAIEATLAPVFEPRSRDPQIREAIDLFGVSPMELAGGISAAGRPRRVLPVLLRRIVAASSSSTPAAAIEKAIAYPTDSRILRCCERAGAPTPSTCTVVSTITRSNSTGLTAFICMFARVFARIEPCAFRCSRIVQHAREIR